MCVRAVSLVCGFYIFDFFSLFSAIDRKKKKPNADEKKVRLVRVSP